MAHVAQSAIPVSPSDVACIDFINSAFTDYLGSGAGADRIASPQWQDWFLRRYELQPTPPNEAPITDLAALRRDLRRILEKWARGVALNSQDVRLLDSRVSAAPIRPRVTRTDEGVEFAEEPLQRDWTWILASVTASAVDLMQTRDPQRLKICGNPGCSWVFYDTTINRSRRYCTSTPCGSLVRVRRFRQPD